MFDFVQSQIQSLQLAHWLIIAGGLLVVVGTIGALVSRPRHGAPSEPPRRESAEHADQD
jgi:hypothetical protein